jgi:hypothetical protein
MSVDITLALQGEYERFTDAAQTAVLQALAAAAYDVTFQAREELKKDTRAAGLGVIERTWRMEMFPARGKLSTAPTGWIYSRAPQIIESFERGVTIGGGPSSPIAIPIPDSPAGDLKNPRGPANLVDAAEAKYGKLTVIPGGPGKAAMLVANNVRFTKTGRLSAAKLTKTGRYRKGAASVPLFWLVPNAHLKKRLNVAKIRHRAERRSAARLRHHLDRHLADVIAKLSDQGFKL